MKREPSAIENIQAEWLNDYLAEMFISIRKSDQGFSYLSISGSRGRLIWEKQLASFQNWENWTAETKQSILLLNHLKKHGKLYHRTIKIF